MIFFFNSKYKFNKLLVVSLFCSSIIPLLVTGPFLPDLLISILSIWFLSNTLIHKKYEIFQNKYFYFFIFFWITCLLSSFFSDNLLPSFKTSVFYIRIAIFSLLISFLINHEKRILVFFYYSFLITFSCIFVDALFQFSTGFNLLGWARHPVRISSFFGEELIMGSFLIRLSPIILALFFVKNNKKPWEYYFITVFFFLVGVCVIISGERASIFYLILITALLFVLLSVNKLKFFSIIFLFCLISSYVLIKNDSLKLRIVDQTVNTIGLFNTKKYIFTPQHESLLKTGWKMFSAKPLLGHGPNSFRFNCSNPKFATGIYPCSTHPHNFYLQLLAETGFVGFFFIFGLFIYITSILIRHFYNLVIRRINFISNYQICLLVGIVVTLWPITSNGNFFNNYLMILYGLQFGFLNRKF